MDDRTGTPLIDVVKGARSLLLHNPEITAVHIVGAREIDAFDRWWAESLVESAELQFEHPRVGSWTVARKPEPEIQSPPRPAPAWTKVLTKLNAIGRWSAGFDGLTEGAR